MYVGLDEVHACMCTYTHRHLCQMCTEGSTGTQRPPGSCMLKRWRNSLTKHTARGRRCAACVLFNCATGMIAAIKKLQFWLAYVGCLVLLLCHVPWLQIAAFICESAVGPGGEIILPKGYLRAVYKWELHAYDNIFVYAWIECYVYIKVYICNQCTRWTVTYLLTLFEIQVCPWCRWSLHRWWDTGGVWEGRQTFLDVWATRWEAIHSASCLRILLMLDKRVVLLPSLHWIWISWTHIHIYTFICRCCAWRCYNGQGDWKWPPNICNCHQSENCWNTRFHCAVNFPQCA